ncbi:DUF4124 domain-containing protein [Niveibacterium terrae]|uniref:DUF4124 domain-containing protein n=1 Tax=Niveibacterium terrae TaxID=3373598 RepID=UPI003A90AF86
MNPSPACLALLILFALPARAEIYKWTDEKGKVHYGDQAPATPKTKTLDIKPTQPGSAQALRPAGKSSGGDERVRGGLYTGLKHSEADKIRETCQRDGKNMSLAQIRDNYCGLEYAGCRALREYQQETENSVARHRGDGGAAQALGDAMLKQLKAKMDAKGC